MRVSDINKLRQELLLRYENEPLKKVHIERYISFLKADAKCNTDINKNGAMVWIENGSQRFAKTNPAITMKLEIAKKLERLEHLIGIVSTPEPPSTESKKTDNKKNEKRSLI